MPSRRATLISCMAATFTAALALALVTAPAVADVRQSGSDRRPSAVVSLGDSYISGVGGRWNGNTPDPTGSRQGTDRAWRAGTDGGPGTYDPALVYGPSAANGCLRADVAEIRSARLPVRTAINLACGGATTRNVLRAASGGAGFKGELPQNDQLAEVAKANDVRLVVLSIGGNDLGFGQIVGACIAAFAAAPHGPPCSSTQWAAVEARLPAMGAAVGRVVDDVHATLSGAGYRRGSYRLVLQSYISPLPAAAQLRYPQTPERATIGGCPFLDVDADWTNRELVPAMSDTLAGVARAHGAQFLDLRDAVDGHELCARTAQQSDGSPSSATSEWVRFIDVAGAQGGTSESIHPNAYGHRAQGRCLALAYVARRDVACRPVPGLPYWGMYVVPFKAVVPAL